jgi:invasion protein IalB
MSPCRRIWRPSSPNNKETPASIPGSRPRRRGTPQMRISQSRGSAWKGLPVAAAIICAPLSAIAQDAAAPPPAAAAPAAPAPTTPAWSKLCNTDQATQKELCLVLQEVRNEQGQVIATATIRQITDDPKISFIVSVPPGMLLQPGLRVQVDTGKQLEVKYGICFPNACYGEIEVNSDFIGSLKGGSRLVITAVTPRAQGVSIPMTLVGFTKAYDGAGTAQDELSKALEASAEAARKKLLESQQKPEGEAN